MTTVYAGARLDALVHEAASGENIVLTAGDGTSVQLVPVIPWPGDASSSEWSGLSLASALRGVEAAGAD